MDIARLASKFEARRSYVALAVFAVIVSTLIVLRPYVFEQVMSSAYAENLSASLPSTANLTLAALNGTEYFLNSSQIATSPSTTAPGGYNQGSPPFNTNNYTGVSLRTLANLVGGLNSGEVLMVEGSDGYAINFTYSQVVNGNFSTFDSITGNPASPTQPIVPILAYYNNSQLIPGESNGGSGPLMVAIVGNDSLVTQGKYWVKWVDKVEVFSTTSVPEFPSASIVPLFISLTLTSAVSSVWVARKSTKKTFFTKHVLPSCARATAHCAFIGR
jgi:hypothetical protein